MRKLRFQKVESLNCSKGTQLVGAEEMEFERRPGSTLLTRLLTFIATTDQRKLFAVKGSSRNLQHNTGNMEN